MTEDRTERIRELEQQISQWQRVHDHELQQERDHQSKLRETLSLSLRVVLIGSIPSAFWLICWAIVNTASDSTFSQLCFTGASLAAYGIVAAGAARGSGLLAHFWFWRSDVRERIATVAIALSCVLLMFWWVIVLAPW